jgi:hypothetical protein
MEGLSAVFAFGVAAGVDVGVTDPATVRFAAACTGAASATATNESNAAEARTPTARERRVRCLFIALPPMRSQSSMEDA